MAAPPEHEEDFDLTPPTAEEEDLELVEARELAEAYPQEAAPGLPEAPPPGVAPSKLHLIQFSDTEFYEDDFTDVAKCLETLKPGLRVWINVVGVEHTPTLRALGSRFNLHPLLLEDIARSVQRAKVEEYEDQLFVVLRMAQVDQGFDTEQVSFVLGNDFLITFQETSGDVFDGVRERLRKGRRRIRASGTDYVLYALIDAVVDAFFPVLEKVGVRVEALEDEIEEAATGESVSETHELRRGLLNLRRALWPTRETLATLNRQELRHIRRETRVYLRDVYDHTVQALDLLETYRELTHAMVELYTSSVNMRMNEVMKVLTVMATIFIPLTFVTGIYGMNFEHMPWLAEPWGFWAVTGTMLGLAVLMLFFFKKRAWL